MDGTSPDNNKLLTDDVRYFGVGGHLFAIAAQKSVDYGYDGYVYGFPPIKNCLTIMCRYLMERLLAYCIHINLLLTSQMQRK